MAANASGPLSIILARTSSPLLNLLLRKIPFPTENIPISETKSLTTKIFALVRGKLHHDPKKG